MTENPQEPIDQTENEDFDLRQAMAMGRVIFNVVNMITTRVIMPAKLRGADPRITIGALIDAAHVLSLVAAGDNENEKKALRDHLTFVLAGTIEDVTSGTPPLSYIHATHNGEKISFKCDFQDVFADQAIFMKASGQIVGTENEEQVCLYSNLVQEEARELAEASEAYEQSPNRAEAEHLAKEACDVIVVAAGVLHSLGFNPGEAWLRVMGSNLSKIDPETQTVLKREDGKVLKGPNFKPADLSDLEWTAVNVPVQQS